jgi:hypothetical protein
MCESQNQWKFLVHFAILISTTFSICGKIQCSQLTYRNLPRRPFFEDKFTNWWKFRKVYGAVVPVGLLPSWDPGSFPGSGPLPVNSCARPLYLEDVLAYLLLQSTRFYLGSVVSFKNSRNVCTPLTWIKHKYNLNTPLVKMPSSVHVLISVWVPRIHDLGDVSHQFHVIAHISATWPTKVRGSNTLLDFGLSISELFLRNCISEPGPQVPYMEIFIWNTLYCLITCVILSLYGNFETISIRLNQNIR